MADMQPFASDNSSAFSPDAERQKKLRSLSRAQLSDLTKYSNEGDATEDLQKEPLYGGDISKSIQVPQDAGEPSALSTERVQRAPAMQEASPLLSPEERAGNLLTGEEGQYGPLAEGDRSLSLKSLFGSIPKPSFGQNADAFSPQDPGTAYGNVQKAKQAYGYANKADEAAGSPVRNTLNDYYDTLYRTLFPNSRGETGGTSLSDTVRSGANGAGVGEGAAGVGYGAGQSLVSPADQAAQYLYGASINPEALPALVDTGASVAAPAAEGTTAATTGASTAAGTSVGAAMGIVGLYSLMKGLWQALGAQGEGPTSGNQWADLGFSFVPVLGDVLMEATKGAFNPSQHWKDYGKSLNVTLGNESRSLKNLIFAAENAKNRGDLTQAANMFQHDIAGEGPDPGQGYVGGWTLADNAANGAPQINGLPGASGSKHEYGIQANFDEPVGATNRLLQALFDYLPEGEASPRNQHAFDWSMTNPEWDTYQAAINQAETDPNLSAYRPDQWTIYANQDNPTTQLTAGWRPEIRDLFRQGMAAENARRYQEANPLAPPPPM